MFPVPSTSNTMNCFQDIIGRIFHKPIYSVLKMMEFTVEYRICDLARKESLGERRDLHQSMRNDEKYLFPTFHENRRTLDTSTKKLSFFWKVRTYLKKSIISKMQAKLPKIKGGEMEVGIRWWMKWSDGVWVWFYDEPLSTFWQKNNRNSQKVALII